MEGGRGTGRWRDRGTERQRGSERERVRVSACARERAFPLVVGGLEEWGRLMQLDREVD